MGKERIEELKNGVTDDIDFVSTISNAIVAEQMSELDSLMSEIRDRVVEVDDVPDAIIEKYFLRLTNALYFITAKCESFGFYDDITKANARLKYNVAYLENQALHSGDAKKPTQSDNQLYAEMNSVDENVLNIIYSRSVKIIKAKVESATEMVRTLSKILSLHMNTNSATSTSRRLCE